MVNDYHIDSIDLGYVVEMLYHCQIGTKTKNVSKNSRIPKNMSVAHSFVILSVILW